MKKNFAPFGLIAICFIQYSFNRTISSDNLDGLNLEAVYAFQRNNYVSDYRLLANDSIVLWEEISDLLPRKNVSVNFERAGKYMRKKTYTNLSDATVISNIEIMRQPFFIKEDVPELNWELSDSTQTLLGYKCTMAKTNFRGRDYLAFYTKDIPANIGPWKFHGLPGLILKVESYSHAEYYNIEAVALKRLLKKTKDYKKEYNKFRAKHKRKFQSWEDFKNDAHQFINDVIKYNKSNYEDDVDEDGGRSGFRLINYLEIFHPSQKETIWYD